jgi:hypothetical protein
MTVFSPLKGYSKMSRPRAKWMRWLPVGTTMMSVGLGIRITRRNGIGAWSFLGETIVGVAGLSGMTNKSG